MTLGGKAKEHRMPLVRIRCMTCNRYPFLLFITSCWEIVSVVSLSVVLCGAYGRFYEESSNPALPIFLGLNLGYNTESFFFTPQSHTRRLQNRFFFLTFGNEGPIIIQFLLKPMPGEGEVRESTLSPSKSVYPVSSW